MGRVCATCIHPKRLEIDKRLITANGDGKSLLAKEYGVSLRSISRHSKVCISRQLKTSVGEKALAHYSSALDVVHIGLRNLLADLQAEGTRLVDRSKLYAPLAKMAEVMGKIRGEIQSGSAGTSVNIHMSTIEQAKEMTDDEIALKAKAYLEGFNQRYPRRALWVRPIEEAEVIE